MAARDVRGSGVTCLGVAQLSVGAKTCCRVRVQDVWLFLWDKKKHTVQYYPESVNPGPVPVPRAPRAPPREPSKEAAIAAGVKDRPQSAGGYWASVQIFVKHQAAQSR